MDKHYTATTYIFDRKRPRTLLHWHEKLQSWLPPGGHIEKNESPEEAARREITEETGLTNITFIPKDSNHQQVDGRCKILMLPHYLLEENIAEDHFHYDWIFFAWIKSDNELDQKINTFRWFTAEELIAEENCFANVKFIAMEGMNKIYQNLNLKYKI